MRFSTFSSTHWTPLLTWLLLITDSWTNLVTPTYSNHLHHPSFSQTLDIYPRATPTAQLRRSIRQASAPEFSWKPTKTPKFITSKVEKNPEPILRVYPPDIPHRAGRSREAPFQPELQQQQPQGRNLGRRIIYYATLPDVPRAPTNVSPLDNRYVHYPMVVANQQRSYNPSKGGKEFVTKVQSSLIGIRPSGDKNKDTINSTPTFTIIDANTTPYSGSYVGHLPYNRVHVDYNMIGNVGDRPNFNYYPSYYNPTHPKNQYELLPQNFVKAQYPVVPYQANPYYGGVDRAQYHQLAQYQQYQHQSSPYLYGNDVTKLPSPYHSPPYPSRHTRFPTDRYPIPSPLSQFNLGTPGAAPPPSNLSPSHQDFNEPNLNSFHQPSLGVNGPSPTVSSHNSDIDLNNNVGSLLDHTSINLDDYNTLGASPFRDKFLDYNTLGHKYFDFNTLTNELPPFKLDKDPVKGTFSQISDWFTNANNKPFDPSGLDLEDATSGNRDYQIKGSAHTVVVDSQMVNQNMTTTVKDSNNTVITPFTNSSGTSVVEERSNR